MTTSCDRARLRLYSAVVFRVEDGRSLPTPHRRGIGDAAHAGHDAIGQYRSFPHYVSGFLTMAEAVRDFRNTYGRRYGREARRAGRRSRIASGLLWPER